MHTSSPRGCSRERLFIHIAGAEARDQFINPHLLTLAPQSCERISAHARPSSLEKCVILFSVCRREEGWERCEDRRCCGKQTHGMGWLLSHKRNASEISQTPANHLFPVERLHNAETLEQEGFCPCVIGVVAGDLAEVMRHHADAQAGIEIRE